ncbi:unnamed protein product [Amoebophrya sp. A120]|nr:unnamed protein product [Amoebophrya sp. A120]|eukprot:GSA120T00020024001.1
MPPPEVEKILQKLGAEGDVEVEEDADDDLSGGQGEDVDDDIEDADAREAGIRMGSDEEDESEADVQNEETKTKCCDRYTTRKNQGTTSSSKSKSKINSPPSKMNKQQQRLAFSTVQQDAARFGFDLKNAWVTFHEPQDISCAHRFRNFLTNLVMPTAAADFLPESRTGTASSSSSSGTMLLKHRKNCTGYHSNSGTTYSYAQQQNLRNTYIAIEPYYFDTSSLAVNASEPRTSKEARSLMLDGNMISTSSLANDQHAGDIDDDEITSQAIHPLQRRTVNRQRIRVPLFTFLVRATHVAECFEKLTNYVLRSDYAYHGVSSFLVQYANRFVSFEVKKHRVMFLEEDLYFEEKMKSSCSYSSSSKKMNTNRKQIIETTGSSCQNLNNETTMTSPPPVTSSASASTCSCSTNNDKKTFGYLKFIPVCSECGMRAMCYDIAGSSMQARDLQNIKSNRLDREFILPAFTALNQSEGFQHDVIRIRRELEDVIIAGVHLLSDSWVSQDVSFRNTINPEPYCCELLELQPKKFNCEPIATKDAKAQSWRKFLDRAMPTILYLLCIRMEIPTEMTFHEYNEQKGKTLRFRVGDCVEARLGLSEDSYFKGRVVKLWDMGFPYRIRIELTGEEVRAPEDHDRCVRAIQAGTTRDDNRPDEESQTHE